jgi:hypothetical protein
MHTIKIIGMGLTLLGVCLVFARLVGSARGVALGALVFLPLWLIGAAINLYIGVKNAGYSVSEELPVFAVVFAVPALVAFALWWKLR